MDKMLAALKIGDFARLGAFVKRLCACAGHAESGVAMAALLLASRRAPGYSSHRLLGAFAGAVLQLPLRASERPHAIWGRRHGRRPTPAAAVAPKGGSARARQLRQRTVDLSLRRVLLRHLKLRGMLDSDAVGTLGLGGYNPFTAEPGNAGALQSTLWELAALQLHFHPHIASMAAAMAAIPSDGGTGSWAGAVSVGLDAAEVARLYSYEASGRFRPSAAPAAPRKRRVLSVESGLGVGAQSATAAYLPEGSVIEGDIVEPAAAHAVASELDVVFRCGSCALMDPRRSCCFVARVRLMRSFLRTRGLAARS